MKVNSLVLEAKACISSGARTYEGIIENLSLQVEKLSNELRIAKEQLKELEKS